MEDKEKITESLFSLLTQTMYFHNLESLIYAKDEQDEWITASFKNGYKKTINVTADSGIALIQDVINHVI